ncbi:MAG: ketopantoate reductase family protein [Candidatus Kariarchaeaceae archaeon]
MIGVFGAGALGSVIVGKLTHLGYEVQALARGSSVEKINENGLEIKGLENFRSTPKYTSKEKEISDWDIVLLTVKPNQTEEAAKIMSRYLQSNAIIVSIQNGVRNKEIISSHCDNEIIRGSAWWSATQLTTNEILWYTKTRQYLESDIKIDQSSLCQLLSKVVPTDFSVKFEAIMWSKLIINLLNAPHALTNSPYLLGFKDPALRTVVIASINEGIKICQENGIKIMQSLIEPFIANIKRSQKEVISWISTQPINENMRHYVSTHKSILDGKKSDIDYLTGEVVSLGKPHTTPINSFILNEVQKMDHLNERKKRIEYYTPTSLLEKLEEKVGSDYISGLLRHQT